MTITKESIREEKLYTVILRNMAAFPAIPFSVDITEEIQIRAAKRAESENEEVFLVSARDADKAPGSATDLYEVGTIADIKHLVELPDGSVRLLCEGSDRASVGEFVPDEQGCYCRVFRKSVMSDYNSTALTAAMMEIRTCFEDFKKARNLSKDVITAVEAVEDPELLTDVIGSSVLLHNEDKQQLLAEFDLKKRMELAAMLLEKEARLIEIEHGIHRKVVAQIESEQKERFLREQMRVIQNELGEENDEIYEYERKFDAMQLPEEVKSKIDSEISKLAKMPYASTESSVLRNWLDVCLEVPFGKYTEDNIDIDAVKKQLDLDHDGLDEVKDRILEFLAVEKLTPDASRQILCLAGPPGTGKTSICASIAKALGRKYVRVSLGGVRDEADIRGHRKTYVASMPGRIIEGLSRAGSMNPLMLLDEVDKMTANSQGDPASALLEVLDSEQNVTFRDHFMEMPIDLSKVMFICTANSVANIPRPLLDRMELINLKIYTRNEKYDIARHHLIPRQLERNGLAKGDLKFTKGAVMEIIDSYTREAGVRELERKISSICRKVALGKIGKDFKPANVTADNIESYLGPDRIRKEEKDEKDRVGIATGLAYTEHGGEVMPVEVALMPGTGKIELTGSLGSVITESAKAAVSYIRSRSGQLGINSDFYKDCDIHIHFPEGAVPKDGPSAGVTIVSALVSGLTGKPTRSDTAMTGEITLRGNVLPIGGLREKSMAAYTSGMKRVLIPKGNTPDIEKCDPEVKKKIEFIPCSSAEDVLREVFAKKQSGKRNSGAAEKRGRA